MEFLQAEITHTGSAVVEAEVMRTPVGRTEDLALLIHMTEIIMDGPTFSLATLEYCHAVLSKEDHTDAVILPSYGDPDIIHSLQMLAGEGLVVGPFSRWQNGEAIVYFDPPLLYAQRDLWFEMELSTAQTPGKIASCRIGYTLEKVGREDFIDALVE